MITPLIGIPCRHDLSVNYRRRPVQAQSEAYLDALTEAGGIPFLIPLNLADDALRCLYDLAHGILLSGGGDIDPEILQEPGHPSLSDVQPVRDRVEMMFSRWAAEDGKPLLGICRGVQVMAVAAGGTLCQDIPSAMPDATYHTYEYLNGNSPGYEDLIHDVEVTANSRLAEIVRTGRLKVNSLHHQAVAGLAAPMTVCGRSPDGVIEAIELPYHPFFLGVQWHPEALTADHHTAKALFDAFVAASDRYANP
ncbi:MAG: gamma-glutamyl-gamma-aminobutyrate hydrolase family protein [Anaerolineae bacterium]|nr:gamma-glutamyl-gamma-aminobutyrate hydrolase family protein [Anaerolineae bacterium]